MTIVCLVILFSFTSGKREGMVRFFNAAFHPVHKIQKKKKKKMELRKKERNKERKKESKHKQSRQVNSQLSAVKAVIDTPWIPHRIELFVSWEMRNWNFPPLAATPKHAQHFHFQKRPRTHEHFRNQLIGQDWLDSMKERPNNTRPTWSQPPIRLEETGPKKNRPGSFPNCGSSFWLDAVIDGLKRRANKYGGGRKKEDVTNHSVMALK